MKYAPLSIASRDDADDAGSRDDAEEDEEAPEDATMTPLARGVGQRDAEVITMYS